MSESTAHVIADINGELITLRVVDTEARLPVTGKVEAVPPQTPAGGVEVVLAGGLDGGGDPYELNNSNSPATVDSAPIPTGKQLYILWINAGGQGDPSSDGSQVDVIWVVGGTEHLITRFLVLGSSVPTTVPELTKALDGTLLAGDGSSFLRIKRTRLSNTLLGVYGEVRGYYS